MSAADIPVVAVKIALALLKHQLANLVGDEALDIAAEELLDLGGEKVNAKVESLFASREGAAKLMEAGRHTDECFQTQCNDSDLRGALSLSFGDLPTIQAALRELPDSLDETALTQTLRDTLHREFPALSADQREGGVELYADCLRRALLPLDDYTFRIIGGAVLRTEKKIDALTREQRAAFQRLEALLHPALAPARLLTPQAGLDDPIDYLNRGGDFAAQGDYDQAIADYNQAIQLEPDYENAYYNRGNAYYHQGHYGPAIHDYSKVLQLRPADVDALYNRARAYHRQGDYDLAIIDYTEAVRLQANDVASDSYLTYYYRGNAYFSKGDYAHAIADYTEVTRRRPEDAEAIYFRGRAYQGQQQRSEALADFAKVRQLSTDANLRQQVQSALSELG